MHACIHTYIHTYIHTNIHTYIHTYRDPEIDRISDIFKKDFQKKNSWNIFKTLCFTRFSSLLKSFLGHFGHGSGEILKNGKVKKNEKIDRIFLEFQKDR